MFGIPGLPEQAYTYIVMTSVACVAILGWCISSCFVSFSSHLMIPMALIATANVAFLTPGFCRTLESALALKTQTVDNIAIALHLLALMSLVCPIAATIWRSRRLKSSTSDAASTNP